MDPEPRQLPPPPVWSDSEGHTEGHRRLDGERLEAHTGDAGQAGGGQEEDPHVQDSEEVTLFEEGC